MTTTASRVIAPSLSFNVPKSVLFVTLNGCQYVSYPIAVTRSKNDPFAGKPAALIGGRLSGRAAKELRELTEALGLRLCALTALLPAPDKEEKKK